VFDSQVKDPSRVHRGHLGAAARWGGPRLVRLDDLNPDERNAVVTLVRLFGAKREPASLSETCEVGSATGGTTDAARQR
jgi:hypothetical protein